MHSCSCILHNVCRTVINRELITGSDQNNNKIINVFNGDVHYVCAFYKFYCRSEIPYEHLLLLPRPSPSVLIKNIVIILYYIIMFSSTSGSH